jgi:hypothetical protein
MINGVEFDEDKTILKPLDSEIKIPEKGFEGWFYKKFPGRFLVKRVILITIIILLFIISFILVSLGKYNIDEKNRALFEDRVKATKLR